MAPEGETPKALTKNPLGPTGKAVAANVELRRKAKNLTFAALSERLTEVGRSIPPLGLRKIVAETRRVDADDLLGLAVALEVSPATLLMPVTKDPREEVAITGAMGSMPAYAAWGWLVGELTLSYRDIGRRTAAIIDVLAYQRRVRPRWLPTAYPGQLRSLEGGDMSVIDDKMRHASTEMVLNVLEETIDGDD